MIKVLIIFFSVLMIQTGFGQIKYPNIDVDYWQQLGCINRCKVKEVTRLIIKKDTTIDFGSFKFLTKIDTSEGWQVDSKRQFDKSGHITEVSYGYSNSRPSTITKYSYVDGKISKISSVQYDKVRSESVYEYSNRTIRINNGGDLGSFEYVYDEQGVLKERQDYDTYGNLTFRKIYTYTESLPDISSVPEKTNVGCIYWDKVDSTWHEESYSIKNGSYVLNRKIICTYKNKKPLSLVEYDKNGLRKIESYYYSENGDLSGIIYFLPREGIMYPEKLEITYY